MLPASAGGNRAVNYNLARLILTFGTISGGHFNPAVI